MPSQKLKAAGITPIALGEKDKWPGHFYWVYLATRIGGKRRVPEKAYSREGSFADPAFVDAGTRLKELVDLQPFQNGFLGAGYGDHQVQMANGQAAMELMGQWAPGANRRWLRMSRTTTRTSAGSRSRRWTAARAIHRTRSAAATALQSAKNAPPEAIEFVRFLTSVENQTAMAKAGIAVPPVVKGAEAGLEDPLLKEVQSRVAQAKYYQLYYDQYLPPAVGQAVNDATQELFAGTSSPEDVAATIENAAATELAP